MNIIEEPVEKKILLKGAVCSGKSSILRERCVYLSDKLKVPGSSILVLLPNRSQLNEWSSFMANNTSSKPRCCTYSSFIHEELDIFYPILAEWDEIVRKAIRPSWLSQDGAVHLISKVIQSRRERDGIFPALVSSNERIAAIIANNLYEAALEGIPANEIGTRLYESLERKDKEKNNIFEDMDKVLQDYRRKCLEIGVFDAGMAVEAYNRHLLVNEKYRQLLLNRIDHIIADDIQECSFVELKLIEIFLEQSKGCFLAYDEEYSNWGLAHDNKGYIEKLVYPECEIVEAYSKNKDTAFYTLAEWLHASIINGTPAKTEGFPKIERHAPVELRSEMLEELGRRICTLIETDGYKPSDIVIISTYADPVTELVISNVLNRKGYSLYNPLSRKNVSDSILCSSMLALAKLCHPEFKLFPEKDRVKQLIRHLVGLDPVRCGVIARKTVNTFPFPQLPEPTELDADILLDDIQMKSYIYISDWIKMYQKREGPKEISSFLQAALIEVFLSDKCGEDEYGKVKQLIDEAQSYSKTAKKFNRNTGRDYIEMTERFSKARDNWFTNEEMLYGEHVLLTTPSSFLSGSSGKKVMVLCSLSSRNWSPGRAKELTNKRVLSASWKKGAVYTSCHEEEDNRQYQASMIRALVKKCCERVLTFESQLSENGYENDGILAEVFMELSAENEN